MFVVRVKGGKEKLVFRKNVKLRNSEFSQENIRGN